MNHATRPALRLVSTTTAPTSLPAVAAARAGDEQALRSLYDGNVGYVTGLCVRLLRSRECGQEAAQEAFATAFEKLSELREDANFRAWLAQIAVHACHAQMRRARWLQFFGIGDAPTPLDELADDTAPAEVLHDLRRVSEALAHVRPEDRIAWTLKHIEGEKLEDIAAACGCSLATAKRRISAAERAIRAQLGESP